MERTGKNKLVLVRGLPGSGKSTYAKTNYKCLVLENDMFHERGGEYQYSYNNMKYAMEWCFSTCERALKLGMDVVVANTFTRRRFVEGYKRLAEKYNADFEVVRCVSDYGNTHNVPTYVLEGMKNGFEDWPGEKIVGNNVQFQ